MYGFNSFKIFSTNDDETLPLGLGMTRQNSDNNQSRQSDVMAAQVFSICICFSFLHDVIYLYFN